MDHVQSERDGAVLHIALNRPEKKNAITADMYDALAKAFEQGESDPAVRVFLLHALGDTFTAGNDLVDFLQKPWAGQETPPAVRFIFAVATATKPIVAAVQGLAVGIGVTILLHCDLIYAAEGARFMMPFIDLGIVPEAGSTLTLPAVVGHHRAAELLLLGAPATAQRAYEMGLLNAVVAPEVLLSTATEAARRLAEKPAGAVLASKRLLKRAGSQELKRAIEEELVEVKTRLDSPETREALSAFLEKRKPNFSKFR